MKVNNQTFGFSDAMLAGGPIPQLELLELLQHR